MLCKIDFVDLEHYFLKVPEKSLIPSLNPSSVKRNETVEETFKCHLASLNKKTITFDYRTRQ